MKLPSLKTYAILLPFAILSGLGLIYLLAHAQGTAANYAHIVLYSLLGGVFSLAGGIILISRETLAQKLAVVATPFAAGALLSTVFLDLLPEGIEAGDVHSVLLATLCGVILFFFAERFF